MATKKKPAKSTQAKVKPKRDNNLGKSPDEILDKIMSDIGFSKEVFIPDSNLLLPINKMRDPNSLLNFLSRIRVPSFAIPKVKIPHQFLSMFKWHIHMPRHFKLPTFRVPQFKLSTTPESFYTEPRTKKDSLPLVIVAAVVALIIAGFWGPQIVRSLGIPIDPRPFTAIYFQDPKIVQNGLVAGDLVVFGVHNGYRSERNLNWHMDTGSSLLSRGQVLVPANGDSHLAVSTSGALPGEPLNIYIEGTSAPITIQVVG